MRNAIMGACAAAALIMCGWLLLISTGLLPRYTDRCSNGRIVYLQDEHSQDKAAICEALR